MYLPALITKSDTKIDKAKFDISAFQNALDKYQKIYGRYPATREELKLLSTNKNIRIRDEFVFPSITDPWGNSYLYQYPGIHNKNSYDIWSFGADNKPGGDGKNIDITNWKQ